MLTCVGRISTVKLSIIEKLLEAGADLSLISKVRVAARGAHPLLSSASCRLF